MGPDPGLVIGDDVGHDDVTGGSVEAVNALQKSIGGDLPDLARGQVMGNTRADPISSSQADR